MRCTIGDPMAGAALSRLWNTHPKVACVLQTLICVMVAAFVASSLLQEKKDWTVIVILVVFLLIETGTLVWFTWDAINNGWARSDY